ncbi:S41 family peptidase [Dokdonella sp.]|uniref:S41 family peptidase n=1 Tax=Dokdonella sp. TaxID=2291710 RepID=UPI001B2743EE|nr:S41 family peptidase [Dokdonella sp.]MBO9661955.1 PD40 domain-containing protein [Dokdonella sp.]
MSARRPLSLAILAGLFLSPAAFAGTKLLRFPDVCGDKVVFTYAGDLWTASTQGGTAARLTAGPGLEESARFSPDCSTIAFTGQYGGDDQVYTIAAGGGEPKQLTFYPAKGPLPQRWGFDNQVYGWTPDGKAVLFRSWEQSISETNPRLYTVPATGGLPTPLPMPVAGVGRYSPDGSKIVYSPKYRDFRTWNRYVGGWAQDLYIYDFAAKSAKNITNDPNTDRDPVWIGDAVYFLADRGAHLNLYRYDTGSGDTKQLTDYQGADARWASGDGKSQIVFEVDGQLHLYDTQANQDRALDITVPSDLVRARAEERSVKDKIEDFALSANGKRALFTARGEVFSVPVKEGITLNLTHTPGAHEREAAWSADGKRIVYVSDQSGEEAIWVRDADGGNAKQLTSETLGRLYAPRWSPDGARIAFVDSNNNVRIVAASGGPAPAVAHDPVFLRRDHVWSPGGHYLAFSLTDKNDTKPRLHVYDLAAAKSVRVGDANFDSFSPSFSPDGQYLYFLGNREWAPQLSNIEWNFAANRDTGLYALALRKGIANPFAPRNDSATGEEKKEGEGDKKDDGKPKAAADVNDRIDFEGIDSRLVRAPIEPDNIAGFEVSRKAIFYVVTDAQYYGRDGAFKSKLKSWSFEERKSTDLFEGVDDASLAADGSTALIRSDGAFKLIDLNAGKPEPKDVKTDGLFALVDPKAEYAEIFRETWRRYRDYFYVQNMHGYDWPAIRAKYEPLLTWVGDRSDLNYLLGQMVAELNIGHAYVDGGDLGLPPKPHVGLLGARFELDAASGQYRIAKILEGQNDEERYRSPLTELGIDVKEGDYVVAINGQPLTANDSPYRLLRTAPGQLVQLTVNGKPGSDGARTVLVQPIDSEEPLNYYAWVKHNREYVAKASNGEIGYLHIPDMGADGIREFIKWYYPQLRKQGLIVDVRDNGGGNVSAMVIERLSRKLLGLDYARGLDVVGTYPNETFLGHLAALCNGTTASDGDIFSHMFKQAKLGPLIGVRTWGGVVGISGWGQAIDGGNIFVPQSASASADGQYVVEGHGVDPDIVVEQDVASLLQGKDPQLDRGIEELKKTIQAAPVKLPARPADPNKAPDSMRTKGASS